MPVVVVAVETTVPPPWMNTPSTTASVPVDVRLMSPDETCAAVIYKGLPALMTIPPVPELIRLSIVSEPTLVIVTVNSGAPVALASRFVT